MSSVDLKQKNKYLLGSSDVGRLQDQNMRKTVQEQLNTELLSLKFNNLENGQNKFRKTICEAADGVLLTTHHSIKLLGPTQLCQLLLHPNIFKASLFTPSQEVPISLKSFFVTSSHPRQG